MTQPLRHVQLTDDDRLGRLVTAGDRKAFSVLYERYRTPLYRYCRSVLRSDVDAHDVVQSTFTRALDALRRDQLDGPLRPWLFRIAHNEAISVLRRRKTSDLVLDDLQRRAIAAEDRAGEREEIRSLFADLRQLPQPARDALVLRELVGLSHDEIAVVLGTTAAGAKEAIFQARRRMREFARGRQMDCREVRRAIEKDRRVLHSRRIRAHLRQCAVCAQFAATESRRSAPLRALTLAIPAGAIGSKLLSRWMHLALSGGAQGPVSATEAVRGFGSKLAAAVAATKAATVVGGLAAAGAVAVGVTYGLRQLMQPAPTPAPPASMSHAAAGFGAPVPRPAGTRAARSARVASRASTSVVSTAAPMSRAVRGVVRMSVGSGRGARAAGSGLPQLASQTHQPGQGRRIAAGGAARGQPDRANAGARGAQLRPGGTPRGRGDRGAESRARIGLTGAARRARNSSGSGVAGKRGRGTAGHPGMRRARNRGNTPAGNGGSARGGKQGNAPAPNRGSDGRTAGNASANSNPGNRGSGHGRQ